jgi:hypothetical protein
MVVHLTEKTLNLMSNLVQEIKKDEPPDLEYGFRSDSWHDSLKLITSALLTIMLWVTLGWAVFMNVSVVADLSKQLSQSDQEKKAENAKAAIEAYNKIFKDIYFFMAPLAAGSLIALRWNLILGRGKSQELSQSIQSLAKKKEEEVIKAKIEQANLQTESDNLNE